MTAVARLHISLLEIRPPIWRRIEVPTSITLKQLHDVIQAVFGWQDYHLFEFDVAGRRYGIPDEEFDPGQPVREARNIRLAALIDRGVTKLDYTYDFGDDWQHRLEIESVQERPGESALPKLLDGARHGPPEDVGGPSGYEAFLEAVADPDHEEHQSVLRWCGGTFEPEDMDTEAIERRLAVIVRRLSAADKRRRAKA